MKLKKIILLLSILLMVTLITYICSADNGNMAKFSEGDKHSTSYTLNENETLYVRFNASTSFNSFDIYFESTQSRAVTEVKLFNWEKTLSHEGEPLEKFEIKRQISNKYEKFQFPEKAAGEYLLCITQKKDVATLRKNLRENENVKIYKDSYSELGSIDINLYYTAVPAKALNPLSEYILPKHTPQPEPTLQPDSFADNIKPDTWTAVDGLNRTLPLYNSLKEKDKDKIVGMFYWTWHDELSKTSRARNINKIIIRYPEAIHDFKHRAWEGYSGYHHWNEPLYGFYSTCDEYVLRKHAEMLADAGVDFIAFDCTNGSYTWTESYMTLLKVFSKAKEDGVKVPKITFMSNFLPIESTWVLLKQLYKELYKPGLYNDLWFYLDGKPLMWAFPQAIDDTSPEGEEIKEFFTFRHPYAGGISPLDKKYSWGWAGSYPNQEYGKGKNGKAEQITVGIAINSGGPMNNPNAWGRSHSNSNYSSSYTYGGKTINVNSKMENSSLYGIFIQEQWDYTIKKDPDIIFVCGWNEWVAMRHEEWGGYENAFPDQFNDEYSRDIEPSKGDLKDHYYYQLVANVRKFKGVNKPETYVEKNIIDINGDISQWNNVKAVFNHYTENTLKRNHAGYVGTKYRSDTMRNDIKTAKVVFDDDYLYFYVETVNNLTQSSDEAFMRLYIDTDFTGMSSNWEGFEYIVNRINPESKCIVEKSKGGWEWEKVYEADYSINNNIMQIKIPRNTFGFEKGIPSFSFKWADNNCVDGDILTFYTDGDAAPGGRFCFAFNVGGSAPDDRDYGSDASIPKPEKSKLNFLSTIFNPSKWTNMQMISFTALFVAILFLGVAIALRFKKKKS